MSKTVKDLQIGETGYINSLVYFTKDTELLKFGDILLCRTNSGFIACKETDHISITLESLNIQENSTLSSKELIKTLQEKIASLEQKLSEVIQKRQKEIDEEICDLQTERNKLWTSIEAKIEELRNESDELDDIDC